jgi:ubiquinone/menaquinone biosynthesis C-methylase UbiE
MSSELPYRSDLYKGTAEYYDRFRPPYPQALLDDLCARVPVTGTGRLLDLACGTGQIAFALASKFSEVVAVDQEVEAIAFARRKATTLGVDHIEWVVASAERGCLGGVFELVAIGNAFHRLARDVVARRLVHRLQPGGCVALLWSDTPWRGQQLWQQEMAETLKRWTFQLGAADRVPQGWEQAMDRAPHAEVLRRAGLAYEGRFEFAVTQWWSIESLTGFVYSTSFLNRSVLGQHADEFESDLCERLMGADGHDTFRQDATFAYELARITM